MIAKYDLEGNIFKITIPELHIDDEPRMKQKIVRLNEFEEGCDEDAATSLSDIQLPLAVPDKISCFAHLLQLTVKDGITSSKQVSTILDKVWKIVNHIKKSTVATESLEKKKCYL